MQRQLPIEPERRSHELAAAFLRGALGAVGPIGAAGDLVAAAAHPTQAANGSFPAVEDPRQGAEARRNPAAKPVVVDAASAADGGARRDGAGRAGLQSA